MRQAITDCLTVLFLYEFTLGFAVGGHLVNECVFAVILDLGNILDLSGSRLSQCADGQGYLVILGVDSGDLSLDNVADGEDLFRLADAAVCDLGNMDQTVNAGKYLGKCAEGHEFYDLDLCGVADIIVSGKLDPGILVGILVAEGDLFFSLSKLMT